MSFPPMQNANSVPLDANPGTLPDLSGALRNWVRPMVFGVVTKAIVNFVVSETVRNVDFRGVWQPFKTRDLKQKPHGQRKWSWFMVHSTTNLLLLPDDIINFKGTQYRVMENLEYDGYGFFEYHLIEDYSGSGPTP